MNRLNVLARQSCPPTSAWRGRVPTVGLPEAVAHTAGAHSGEGELIQRSLENTLVHHADYAYWHVLGQAGQLEEQA